MKWLNSTFSYFISNSKPISFNLLLFISRRNIHIRTQDGLLGTGARIQDPLRHFRRAWQRPIRRSPQGRGQGNVAKVGGQIHKMQDGKGQGQGAGGDRHNEPAETPEAASVGGSFREPKRNDNGYGIVSII